MVAAISDWTMAAERVSVGRANLRLPLHTPGLYAFFVKHISDLPPCFSADTLTRPLPELIYIGQASRCLLTRAWHQDCRHKGAASYFRSVGVMLGFSSVTPARNYKFSQADTNEITAWMDEHVSVSWTSVVTSLNSDEKEVIRRFTPLLNIRHNPRAFTLLRQLRKRARQSSLGALFI